MRSPHSRARPSRRSILAPAVNQFVFKSMDYGQAKDIAPVIIGARYRVFAGHPFAAGETRRRIDRLRQLESGRIVVQLV
jgi:hypothetical protein